MEDALIAAVYKRKPLWNPSNKLYKNVPVMKKLWDEVANETNIDEKTVRAKWKNLRTYYFRELRRMEKSKSDEDGETGSTWQYFNKLAFLTSKDARLERDSIMDYSISFEEERSPKEKIIKIEQEESPPSGPSKTTRKSKLVQRQSSLTKSPVAQKSVQSRKRARFVSEEVQSEEGEEEDEAERMEIETLEDSNDDLLFFQSLLPYMKTIPLKNKLRLRSRIQNIILDELS